jgi:hypothetical protein
MSEGGRIPAEDVREDFWKLGAIQGIDILFEKRITDELAIEDGLDRSKIDICSQLETIPPSATKPEVLEKLLGNKGEDEALYVVDKEGVLLGSITPHDYIRKDDPADELFRVRITARPGGTGTETPCWKDELARHLNLPETDLPKLEEFLGDLPQEIPSEFDRGKARAIKESLEAIAPECPLDLIPVSGRKIDAEYLMEPREHYRLSESDTLKDALQKVVGTNAAPDTRKGQGFLEFIGDTLPVIDGAGKLVGSVAEADIMKPVFDFILTRNHIREALGNRPIQYSEKIYPLICSDSAPYILESLREIEEGEDDTLLVTDDSNKLNGAISSRTMLAWMNDNPPPGAAFDGPAFQVSVEGAREQDAILRRLISGILEIHFTEMPEVVKRLPQIPGVYPQSVAEEFKAKVEEHRPGGELEVRLVLCDKESLDTRETAENLLKGQDLKYRLGKDSSLLDACELITGGEEAKFIGSSIPVVTQKYINTLVGVVTEADIIRDIEEVLRELEEELKDAELAVVERESLAEKARREAGAKRAEEEEKRRQQQAEEQRLKEAARKAAKVVPAIISAPLTEVAWDKHREALRAAEKTHGGRWRGDSEEIVRGIESLLDERKDFLGLAFDDCREDHHQKVFKVDEGRAPDPEKDDVWFFGDIHGDLLGMLAAMDYADKKSAEAGKEPLYVFLGDFTDRGPFDYLVLLKLYSMILDEKLRDRVCVIAGNHDECLQYNEDEGEFYATVVPAEFTDWLNAHRKDAVWQRLGKITIEFFKRMPRAIFLPDGLFFAHAGVPHTDLHGEIDSIEKLNADQCLEDFAWTRAHERAPKRRPNRNTRGCSFGRKDFKAFCDKAGEVLDLRVDGMLRGHDHYLDGHRYYEKYMNEDKQMLTLNTRCIQPDMMDGPYSKQVCIARWTRKTILPEIHEILAPKDILMDVFPTGKTPAEPMTEEPESSIEPEPSPEPEPTVHREPVDAGALVLEGPAGGSISIHARTHVGKSTVDSFGEDAQFWDEPQFTLIPVPAGWAVLHNSSAKHETLLNGRTLTGSQPLKNGDQLAVGRESKGIIKLPLRVKIN